jgi:hypothetical protein
MKTLEEGVEGIADHRCREGDPPAALQGMRLEETSIEKGHGAVAAGQPAAFLARPVECAEEERAQQVVVQRAAGEEAAIHFLPQKTGATGEPPLGLDEIEEEDAGQEKEGERMTIDSRDSNRKRGHDALEHPAESGKEALVEALPGERLADPKGRRECALSRCRSDALETRHGKVIGSVERDLERWGRPGGDREAAPGFIESQDCPRKTTTGKEACGTPGAFSRVAESIPLEFAELPDDDGRPASAETTGRQLTPLGLIPQRLRQAGKVLDLPDRAKQLGGDHRDTRFAMGVLVVGSNWCGEGR